MIRGMKQLLKNPAALSAGVAVILYLAAGMIFFFYVSALPNEDLIIRFNGTEGIKSLGEKWNVLGIFGTSGILIGGNFFLARELFFRERVLAFLLLWGSGLIALFTLIVTGLIISIN